MVVFFHIPASQNNASYRPSRLVLIVVPRGSISTPVIVPSTPVEATIVPGVGLLGSLVNTNRASVEPGLVSIFPLGLS